MEWFSKTANPSPIRVILGHMEAAVYQKTMGSYTDMPQPV